MSKLNLIPEQHHADLIEVFIKNSERVARERTKYLMWFYAAYCKEVKDPNEYVTMNISCGLCRNAVRDFFIGFKNEYDVKQGTSGKS